MEPIESLAIENEQNFWRAVKLSIVKPHTISRKLAGSEIQGIYRCSASEVQLSDELLKRIATYTSENNEERIVNSESLKKCLKTFSDGLIEEDEENFLKTSSEENQNLYFVLSKLLSRKLKGDGSAFELAVLDNHHDRAAFITLSNSEATNFVKTFFIELKKDLKECRLSANALKRSTDSDECFTRQCGWVKHSYLPKIIKWMTSMENENEKCEFENIESLSLINLSEYIELYNELKVKYGEHMVKIWPEQTDPLKFVYEDVAIATYLILLWRLERQKQNSHRLQSFVDLGCGNGLLVYILSGEGHLGYGIDLRKRGIWDLYPSTTILKTIAIVPSDCALYPDVDWIIGNHSDELSPWIPIISARSSYESKFFLLPCCAYEFNGKKYQRRSTYKSQYMDFLQYAKEISEMCGFETKIDRLKIPSTKRICLIGSTRQYSKQKQTDRIEIIQTFINNETGNLKTETTVWNDEFKPRSNVERVQNCTQIDKGIVNDIIEIVFRELISKKRYLTDICKENWNIGGKVSLSDLVKKIPTEKLKALKSECGGLQTLLKNNWQIFHVIGGTVEIRVPVKWSDKKRELEAKKIDKTGKIQFKQKPCWFLQNHPDGCPFDDASDCSFKH